MKLARRVVAAFRWKAKQRLAGDNRFYGDGGTIHRTTALNVETFRGEVVSVWFRCQLLPFTQHEVTASRALEMRKSQDALPELHGVEVRDA